MAADAAGVDPGHLWSGGGLREAAEDHCGRARRRLYSPEGTAGPDHDLSAVRGLRLGLDGGGLWAEPSGGDRCGLTAGGLRRAIWQPNHDRRWS